MIRIFLVASLLLGTLLASNILSYNIYDRTDRVDIMLTFDTPYRGKILKSRHEGKIVLKLYDAKIESSKIKRLSSRFLKSLSINPMNGYTQIVASVPTNDILLKVSKTADAYGLRLRFVKKNALSTASQIKRQAAQNGTNRKLYPDLPTKQSDNLSASYYIVVTLLVVMVMIMFIVKKRVVKQREASGPKAGWLFKSDTVKKPTMQGAKPTPEGEDVSIRFQKRLDEHNSVVMLDFLDMSYLVLLGAHNNILLEKFHGEKPATQSEFEALLQEKNSELDTFLKVEQHSPSEPPQPLDPLRSFSNKASHTPYE